MKFDFIIGNPPYHQESNGDNTKFNPSIYDKFMDECFKLSDRVELITPGRFLFNAGNTPSAWNEKILSDNHFKVLQYSKKSNEIFPGTDIKGGIAISYRDATKDFGPIITYTPFSELNSLKNKVFNSSDFVSITDSIYLQVRFNLESLYHSFPNSKSRIGSEGKDKRLEKNIFDKVPEPFSDNQINTDDIHVIGILNNKRTWKYIPQKYIDSTHENLFNYKVLVPTSNGSGALGEVLSTPLIANPLIGYTRSFIGIGSFETEAEAIACLKYIKTKFARVLLGVLKVTQDNNRDTWKFVPLQDFSVNSDIDWAKSIPEIDKQLYRKYGLEEHEIQFIESHVKEME